MFFSPSKLWFNFISSNLLVYNICWEDVEVDWKLLQLEESSDVLMITSAGCNALTYLLDDPNSIHTVDINPKQTALLDLKIAAVKHGDYLLFEELFAKGKSNRIRSEFENLAPFLSGESQKFWKEHLRFFDPEGRGFFHQGGAGFFARFLNFVIDQKGVRNRVNQLFSEPDHSKRKEIFEEIEQTLWNGLEQNVWVQGGFLGLAGIPVSQREAIGDLNEFMKSSLFNVFVNQFAHTNPYWSAYILGEIPEAAYPVYLKEENFPFLQESINQLHHKTSSFLDVLKNAEQSFSHFVLLDHMDWMTDDEKTLEEQWRLLLKRATPQAQILFRTAHPNLQFIPDFVFDEVEFVQVDPNWIANEDQVGTYSGTYLGTII